MDRTFDPYNSIIMGEPVELCRLQGGSQNNSTQLSHKFFLPDFENFFSFIKKKSMVRLVIGAIDS